MNLNVKAKNIKCSEGNTGVNILLIILPLILKWSMILLSCELCKVNIISVRVLLTGHAEGLSPQPPQVQNFMHRTSSV